MIELALAEDQVAEHQKPAGLAFNDDTPLHRRLVASCDRPHRDGPLVQAVDPAAVAEPELEG